MAIDFLKFLNEGVAAQQKYAEKANLPGPLDDLTRDLRHKLIIENLSHLVEETVEARMLVPRRFWKVNEESFLDSEEGIKSFCYEMTDILLFFRATMAFSGISAEKFEEHFNAKIGYNAVRTDHNR